MIIDAHAHIFNSGIIDNVAQRVEMANHLHLEMEDAGIRTGVKALEEGMRNAGVEACLVLPTASPENINKTNSAFINTAAGSKSIYTAGTLHPDYVNNRDELGRFKKLGIRAIPSRGGGRFAQCVEVIAHHCELRLG